MFQLGSRDIPYKRVAPEVSFQRSRSAPSWLPSAANTLAKRRRSRSGHPNNETGAAPAANPIHAGNAAVWAQDVLNFSPDDKQRAVLESTAKRGILNCTRQWGKSTTCAIKAVHHAYFNPESLVLVASPSLRQSSEFLRKARKALVQLGIRPKGDGDNRCSLMFPNGSRIVGIPESEGTIRGFDKVGLLIIDEASRVSGDLYYALRPMLSVGSGALWLMSTPNGQSGFFHYEWSQTKPNWLRITATAEECPRIPADFLQEERETMTDEMFRQEYNCEFICGEGTLFDEASIRARISTRLPPLW